jgi:hypothetical protein
LVRLSIKLFESRGPGICSGRRPGLCVFDFDGWLKMMLSHVDICRAAHVMLHAYGSEAEDEAARYCTRMVRQRDPGALVNWLRIRRTIALLRVTEPILPH